MRATDLATPVMNRISSELNSMAGGVGITGRKMTSAISGVSAALRVLSGIGAGLAVGAIFEFGRSLFNASEQSKELEGSLDSLAQRLSTLPFGQAKKKLEELTTATGTTFFGLLPRSFGEDAKIAKENIDTISKSMEALFSSIEEARLDPLSKAGVAFRELEKFGVKPFDENGNINKLSSTLQKLSDVARQSDKQLQEFVSGVLGTAAPAFEQASEDADGFRQQLGVIADEYETRLPKGFRFVSELLKKQKDEMKAAAEAAKQAADQAKLREESAAKEAEERHKREIALLQIKGITLASLEEIRKKATFDAMTEEEKINDVYEQQVKNVRALALVTSLNADEQKEVNQAVNDTIAALDKLKLKQLSQLEKKPKTETDQAPEKLTAVQQKVKQLTEEVDEGLNLALITTTEIIGQGLMSAFDMLAEKGMSTAEKLRAVLQSIARDISQTLLSIGIKAGISALFASAAPTGGGIGPADTSIPTGQTDLQVAAQGGIFPGGTFLPMKAFASGGVVNKPTLGLIGEGGDPELVVPIKGGKVPVQKVGKGRGEAMVINLNVSANDAKSFEDMLSRPGARRMIRDSIREMTASDLPYRSQVRSI